MAGIAATGQVRHALVDRAAQAITADATEWQADLIMLGVPRRGRLATRLFGSVTAHVQRHAPCPVLVAPATGKDRRHHPGVTSVTGRDLDPAPSRSDDLSATSAR